jgi:uncharacterized protein YndB with AHSA1/START domain
MEDIVMNDSYRKKIRFRSTPDQVYRAVATKRGIAGWWTHLIEGAPSKLGKIAVRFDGMNQRVDLKVERLLPVTEVAWRCLRHSAFPEWRGTRIIFRLTESSRGTCELDFTHEGLTPQLACYEEISAGWNYFLRSLTAYAETGEGTPFRKQD